MRLELLDNLVNAFAQIFRFEVSTGLWALILLTCIIVGIDTLVIGEVYILTLFATTLAIGLPFNIVLILGVVR